MLISIGLYVLFVYAARLTVMYFFGWRFIRNVTIRLHTFTQRFSYV